MSLFTERAVVHVDVSALLARIMASPANSITNVEVARITIANLDKKTIDELKLFHIEKYLRFLDGLHYCDS
jgi:hypothetical protein